MVAVRVLAFLLGLAAAGATCSSAIRTVVVPRSESLLLQRIVFTAIRQLLAPLVKRARTWEERDRVLAYYAPFGLVLLAITWLALVSLAFTPMFWALEAESWRTSFRISGSSITTLGFASTGTDWPGTVLSVIEAIIGLILVALLISFLPTMYSLFSLREQTVSFMAVRSGTPPSGVELLERFHRIGDEVGLGDIWMQFETWFNELGETHTSFMALPFFRSPNPARSWVTTGGAVLDAASIWMAAVVGNRDPRAALCVRAGYTALREIADAYRIEVPADPSPDDPISVAREEFDGALDRLAAAGMAVAADRDRAWRDFQGWRVNYDVALITLAAFVSAPYAPWSSDRSLRIHRPTVRSLLIGRARHRR